ncbi:NADP-dependent oxidoreductase [Kineococcus sp. SYSU DK005]|uniref:NADP-dependent oxidoreductase n=1 Tax=Kineococcus sp. SYSU DK005 TaxID=3383126 RepID=UPI003D7E9C9A
MVEGVNAREIRLARRPQGEPVPDDFELAEVELPAPGEGELLVRTLVMSVDPYMRPRMDDVPSYVPPYRLGQPLDGGAVGVVEVSRADGFSAGDLVLHGLGWRSHAVLPAARVRRLQLPAGVPETAALGPLGMVGFTAWAGLFDVARVREGDTVFVSGAAGAVGSLAGQFAKLRGAGRVVGSAGGPEKARHLTADLGFDAGIDYREGPVLDSLLRAAPDGVDVYFDNVGGDHLEAAIAAANDFARFALCGSVSAYNSPRELASAPPGPRNLFSIVGKRLRLQGFIVGDHEARREEFQQEVGGWLAQGRLVFRETVREGLEAAPGALVGLLRGENTGKMLVRLSQR